MPEALKARPPRLTFELSPGLLAAIESRAAAEQRSVSGEVRHLLGLALADGSAAELMKLRPNAEPVAADVGMPRSELAVEQSGELQPFPMDWQAGPQEIGAALEFGL